MIKLTDSFIHSFVHPSVHPHIHSNTVNTDCPYTAFTELSFCL